MTKKQTNQMENEDTSQSRLRDKVGEFLVRGVFIVAIIGILSPLFIQSISSITSPQYAEEIPIMLLAVLFAVILPPIRWLFRGIVQKLA